MSRPWIALAVLAGITFAAQGTAEAGKGGFAVGETIEHLDLPKGPLADKAREAFGGGGEVQFGFKYSYFGIGAAPLWTYDGNFVLYNSAGGNVSQYIVLTDDEIRQLNGGKIPTKPFLYRVPIGLIIFPTLILAGLLWYFVWRPLKKRKQARGADDAARDPRYAQALRMTEPVEHRDEDGDLVTAPRHSHAEAIDWLVAQGIPRAKAEANYSALEERRDGAD
jgi:hypothetical protein